MGEALSPPLIEPVPRRVIAAATALLANLLLFALIFALPRKDFPVPDRPPFEVTLLTLPDAPEEAPAEEITEDVAEQDIPVEQQAEPETREASEPDAPVVIAAPAEPALAEDHEDAPAAEASAGAGLQSFNGEPLALPAGPGSTQMFVRNVFCSSTSEANREAGACPDRPDENTFQFVRFGSEEELARIRAAMGLDLSPAEIHALFNSRLTRDLTGQPTMTNQHSQHTSSADSMRDSLPALVPDPAFGD